MFITYRLLNMFLLFYNPLPFNFVFSSWHNLALKKFIFQNDSFFSANYQSKLKCSLAKQDCVFVRRTKCCLNSHYVLTTPTNTLMCQYTGLFTYKVNVKQRENPCCQLLYIPLTFWDMSDWSLLHPVITFDLNFN